LATLIYDNLGFAFRKVARLTARGLARVGYRECRLIPIHSLFYEYSYPAVVIYDTKLYERKSRIVRAATRSRLALWLDSPVEPSALNPEHFEGAVHLTTLPYWLREYSRVGVPVHGWVPRPVDYETAVEVSRLPREYVCRDLWSRYGRYVIMVGSDNRVAPSKPPRKGVDAYDAVCAELRGVRCLYVGSWDPRNAVKVSGVGGLGEYSLLRLVRCAEVFVWPSRSEGFGMPPVEAMAVGTVVVSSTAPFNDLVVGVKFDYRDVVVSYCPEVGFPFRLFDYDVRELRSAVEQALEMPEDEKEELRVEGTVRRELFRPDLVALAVTQA